MTSETIHAVSMYLGRHIDMLFQFMLGVVSIQKRIYTHTDAALC